MLKRKYSLAVKNPGDVSIVQKSLSDVSDGYGNVSARNGDILLQLKSFSRIGKAQFSLRERKKRDSYIVDIEYEVKFGFGFMFAFIFFCILLAPTVIGLVAFLAIIGFIFNSLSNTCLEICKEAESEYNEEIEYAARQ